MTYPGPGLARLVVAWFGCLAVFGVVACSESKPTTDAGVPADASGSSDAGPDAGTPVDGAVPTIAKDKAMPVGLTLVLEDADTVRFVIDADEEPELTFKSALREETIAAIVRPEQGSWVAELSGLNTNERGTLLVGPKVGAAGPTAFEWVFEAPNPDGESEVHSFEGSLSLTLPEGTSADVRLSMFAPPVGGAVAGPFELAALGGLQRASAVFSPGDYPRGFEEVVGQLQVLHFEQGQWREITSVIHPELGRVAFEAELPGAYVLVEVDQ